MFLIDAVPVQIEKHRAAAVFLWKIVTEVDRQPAVRMTTADRVGIAIPSVGRVTEVMPMISYGVNVRINMLVEMAQRIALAQVVPALDDVPEMRDHAGLREQLALFVKVNAP